MSLTLLLAVIGKAIGAEIVFRMRRRAGKA